LVYQLDFRSKSCDTQSFCATVDPYPNNKKGYYAYDFSKDTKTYLGDYFITNNWSSDSRFVYISEGSNYHDYNLAGGSFRINVNDGVAKTLDRSSEEYSSVTAYYIEEREIQNIFVGTVGNAQTKASIKYIVNKGRIQAVIDSQVFGDIPASLIISPSREKAIYTRKATDIDGKTFYEFVLTFQALQKIKIILLLSLC